MMVKKILVIVLCLTAMAFAINRKYIQPVFSTKGLVAHYKLWVAPMTTDKVFDYSLNGNTGTITDTDSTLKPVYPGFAFDGVEDYIDTSSSFQSTYRNSFSISMWVKLDDGQPAFLEDFFGSSNASVNDILEIRTDAAGTLTFYFESDNDMAEATTAAAVFSNGQQEWTHIVGTAEADTQLRIYVNGSVVTLDGTNDGDASGLTFADWTSSDNSYIGALNSNGTAVFFMAGDIDDVRIYNRALSATDVLSIYSITRHRYQK